MLTWEISHPLRRYGPKPHQPQGWAAIYRTNLFLDLLFDVLALIQPNVGSLPYPFGP